MARTRAEVEETVGAEAPAAARPTPVQRRRPQTAETEAEQLAEFLNELLDAENAHRVPEFETKWAAIAMRMREERLTATDGRQLVAIERSDTPFVLAQLWAVQSRMKEAVWFVLPNRTELTGSHLSADDMTGNPFDGIYQVNRVTPRKVLSCAWATPTKQQQVFAIIRRGELNCGS